ncbi:MAG: hypothetical protein V4615_05790 [Bacteroidota bacterium]
MIKQIYFPHIGQADDDSDLNYWLIFGVALFLLAIGFIAFKGLTADKTMPKLTQNDTGTKLDSTIPEKASPSLWYFL